MKPYIKLISEHSLTMITGAVSGSVATIWLSINDQDVNEYLSTTGTLMSGLGTVILVYLAFIKANEWIGMAKHGKRLDLLFSSLNNLLTTTQMCNDYCSRHFSLERILMDSYVYAFGEFEEKELSSSTRRKKLDMSSPMYKEKKRKENSIDEYSGQIESLKRLSEICYNLILDDQYSKKLLKVAIDSAIILEAEVNTIQSMRGEWKLNDVKKLRESTLLMKLAVEKAVVSITSELK